MTFQTDGPRDFPGMVVSAEVDLAINTIGRLTLGHSDLSRIFESPLPIRIPDGAVVQEGDGILQLLLPHLHGRGAFSRPITGFFPLQSTKLALFDPNVMGRGEGSCPMVPMNLTLPT